MRVNRSDHFSYSQMVCDEVPVLSREVLNAAIGHEQPLPGLVSDYHLT